MYHSTKNTSNKFLMEEIFKQLYHGYVFGNNQAPISKVYLQQGSGLTGYYFRM
jgi:hypothetical protein